MDEGYWSTRNIAEYAYCPRLFYFMEVEGVSIPSGDTEEGLASHRRVDKPSRVEHSSELDQADADRPKTIRSLVLSSDSLRLTATLDLAEISDGVAVPVEYRKGRPRRIREEACGEAGEAEKDPIPWPTDRVQVGLQAILLEEAGYRVHEAIIYYGQEKRRLPVVVDEDFKAEALQTLEEAKLCSVEQRPPPLVNDPRCVGCSLQPLCLPDEVNLLSSQGRIRKKLWPPRDDGIHVVAQKEGIRIGVRGLELRLTGKEGKLVKSMPLANLESLSLLGSVQISTQAIRTIVDKNIPIAFLSPAGRLVAMVDPLDSVSAEVRKAQVRQFDRSETCLDLARALVSSKITNQRTLLMRNHDALPERVANDLAEEARQASEADTIESVRGHEGQAAAIYFAHFAALFKGKLAEEFDANGRKRRPPPDPINACLSLGYSMLTHECVAALRLARLEPTIGGFHVSRPGRPALALDLMEPFRPLVADSIAISLFNRGEIGEKHFVRTASGCSLTEAGRRSFFGALGRRMDTEVTHPVFKYRLSYRRMIVLHARMIANWLMEEVPSLSFLTTR